MGKAKSGYSMIYSPEPGVQSYRTAAHLGVVSEPMQVLVDMGLLVGRVLDYGCGHGVDADKLGFDKYDPYWWNVPLTGGYDVVTCHYVLNVLRYKKDRGGVVGSVLGLLRAGGVAYFTVRRDIVGCFKTPEGWMVSVRGYPGWGSKFRSEKFEVFVVYG